jgi:hypothetical protein
MAHIRSIAEGPRPGPGRRIMGRLRDRVAASDPAFSRLRLSGRAMLSVLVAVVLLAAVTMLVHPLPLAAYGLGFVIALTGSMAVRDPTPLGQMVTRSLAAIGSILSVLLASLLAPMTMAADLVFLVVIFAAVYVRKFGMRWFAIGMIAVMSYFMGDYMKPAPADMGWVALAAVLAFAATHLVANFILADDRERDFRRAMVTIDRRINLILRDLMESPRAESLRPDRRGLERHVARLRDIMLMAEGFLPQGEDGALAGEGPASELAVALFELQLAVERMVRASFVTRPPVGLMRAVLHHDDEAVAQWIVRSGPEGGSDAAAARLLLRVHRTRERLEASLGPRPSVAFAAGPGPAPAPGNRPAGPKRETRFAIPAGLQVPIQVTLACGIAMGCGLLLSPVRWYWAVIAAFIVFNNARSRADTALRAFQRSAGTLAGLIAGIIVATLVGGQMVVSAVGILALFFVGFYFVQASYSTMIFCITVALALLYGVMGMFTPELLLLRLEETMIGAIAGTASAFLVFPSRATEGVGGMLAAYLDALSALVDASRRRAGGDRQAGNLLALSRALDRSYADLANAARPLGGPWHTVTRYGAVRQKLLLLSGCVHWGRTLARSLVEGEALPAETIARIDTVAEEAAGRIDAARNKGVAIFAGRRHRQAPSGDAARPPLAISQADDPAFSLEVISALLARISG